MIESQLLEAIGTVGGPLSLVLSFACLKLWRTMREAQKALLDEKDEKAEVLVKLALALDRNTRALEALLPKQ